MPHAICSRSAWERATTKKKQKLNKEVSSARGNALSFKDQTLGAIVDGKAKDLEHKHDFEEDTN